MDRRKNRKINSLKPKNVKLDDISLTDSGNGEVIVKLFGDRLRYDNSSGNWFIWEKHYWRKDSNNEIRRLALTACRERLRQASKIDDERKRQYQANWAIGSESIHRIKSAIESASSMIPISTTIKKFNKNPMLLGCKNGVVDLKTGELRIGNPDDMITLNTHIEYTPEAKAKRWLQFLNEIFNNDKTLIDFVKRSFGYSLTASAKGQCLFVLYGTGANGKSVFINVLKNVLGDYAEATGYHTLEKFKYDNKIPNDLAALVSKRLVIVSEVKDDFIINEGRIKALTGGDPVQARFLYHEYFTYFPTYKFWIAANHKPQVSDMTFAFWRRIHLIPFEQRFVGDNADLNLMEKLLNESPGILNWAIEGCLQWQKEGLTPPSKVIECTKEYQTEMDVVKRFLEENTIQEPNATIEHSQLYEDYSYWCNDQGENKMTTNMFGRRLKELGFEKKRRGVDKKMTYLNLKLN